MAEIKGHALVKCPRCHNGYYVNLDCALCEGTRKIPAPMAVEYALLGESMEEDTTGWLRCSALRERYGLGR